MFVRALIWENSVARFSAWALAKNALTGNQHWDSQWRKPDPKPAYDVIIIGGGGHGLATAFYLAKEHGIHNVAVVEKGWIGGGNVGRNTTIVRSNYELRPNALFYEHSMRLWEGLSQVLNYNVMFSQRGVLNLAHSPGELDAFATRGNALRLHGIDAELLDRNEVARFVPQLDMSAETRFPIVGGLLQPRAGTARHDAIAWGYARAADHLGIDILENCEVTGFLKDGDAIIGVQTTRGDIKSAKIGVAVAGSTSDVMRKAGIENLPIESHVLQAFVSESLKPAVNTVVTGGGGHFYMSQSDKGGLVYGGNIDKYNSYAQRGNLPVIEDVHTLMLALYPQFAKLRMLRHWGGIMDMSLDGSPIITKGPLPGLYLNAGWCYGGFKATPASGWCFAHTIANDAPHALNAAFTLERFNSGYTIDEGGAGPFAKLH